MIEPEDILEVMGRQVKKVCDKVFPQDRPNATSDTLKRFVVVSIPYSPSNRTVGETDDWWVDQTVVFEIYVADRKTADNPKEYDYKTMRTLRRSVKELFPIFDHGLGIKITRPRTVIAGSSDGNGYHYSRIQAKMTTMV